MMVRAKVQQVPEQADRFVIENTLLVAATRNDDGWTGAAEKLDVAYLLRAAAWQGVSPLLHDWLGRHPGVCLDAAVTAALHTAYWTEHFRNRALIEELRALQGIAASEGIELMALKGARLAPEFYAAPALRPLSDLDFLVRTGDVGRVGALLEGRGYAPVEAGPSYVDDEHLDADSREHGWLARRPGLDILVEYRAAPLELTVGRLTDLDAAYRSALGRHADTVWERATPAPDGAGRVMSPEDLLLHVATHLAAKHLSFRLIWLHDIARIVAATPRLDWAYVAGLAQHRRVSAPVSAALDAARRYAAAAVTDAQLDLVRAGVGSRSVFSLAQRDLRRLSQWVAHLPDSDLSVQGPSLWPLGAALSRVRGVRPRLRVLRWVLLPGRDYLTHRGHAGSSVLGGLMRRLAGRRAGQ